MTNSEVALVRLYYESYGMDTDEISRAVGISKVLVESLVKEKSLVPAVKKTDVDKRQILIENDLDRQLLLSPLYARTEVAILGKAYEITMGLDPEDENAPAKLANIAKCYNSLKNASVSFKGDDMAAQQGIAIQILNSM